MADKKSDWLTKIDKVLQKPIIPEPPNEETFPGMVAFPDADATPEEIEEYIRTGNIEE